MGTSVAVGHGVGAEVDETVDEEGEEDDGDGEVDYLGYEQTQGFDHGYYIYLKAYKNKTT